MKKIIILISLGVVIIATVWFNYANYQSNNSQILKYNLEFEKYLETEIYGTDLTTIINKVINSNEKNKVEIGQNKTYVDNEENSIRIDIQMKDIDKIYTMETLYNAGIENFVEYYADVKFKCTSIEYHQKTKKVKYLYFEQITQ